MGAGFVGGWLGAGAPSAFGAYVAAFLEDELALALGAKLDLLTQTLGGADQGHRQKPRRPRGLVFARVLMLTRRRLLLSAWGDEHLAFDGGVSEDGYVLSTQLVREQVRLTHVLNGRVGWEVICLRDRGIRPSLEGG